jgi:hypothetical protein
MVSRFSHLLAGTAAVLVLSLCSPATLAADDDDAQADKLAKALEKQGKNLADEEKALKAQERKLANEQAEFDALKAKIEKLTGKKIKIAQSAGTSPSAPGEAPDEIGTDHKPVQPEKPPEVAKYIEEGGVLLPKGELLITPGLEYDRSSAVNVAIQGFSIIPALNIGDFEVAKVSQDILTATMDARLGITNRLELEAKVPYVYGDQDTLGRPIGIGSSNDTLTSIDGKGLGDIEFGAHYQVNKGQNDWPFFIANLRYKTDTGTGPFQIPVDSFGQETKLPTGSGFNAVQPSVTIIYPSDPVVFYSNVGYTHNFQRSFATYGTIDPGDSVNASFGMSVSLNDATSFSLGYSHSMVFDTTQNGQVLPGSQYLQVGSVDLGWSYIINDRVSLNLNASIGVTDDAPSDRVILRVPVAFDLFK